MEGRAGKELQIWPIQKDATKAYLQISFSSCYLRLLSAIPKKNIIHNALFGDMFYILLAARGPERGSIYHY